MLPPRGVSWDQSPRSLRPESTSDAPSGTTLSHESLPSVRRRIEEMAALPAVSAATPPAIKPAFRSLLLFTPPPRAANESPTESRSRSGSLFVAKKSHDLAPCLARRRAAFVMASTSSPFVMLERFSIPMVAASSTSSGFL